MALSALVDQEVPGCQVHPAVAHSHNTWYNIQNNQRNIHCKIFTAESSNPLSYVTWPSTKASGSRITLRARTAYITKSLLQKTNHEFYASADWFIQNSATYIHAYRPLSTCNAWFSSEALITNTHRNDTCVLFTHCVLFTLLMFWQQYQALRGLPSHREGLGCHLGLVVQVGPNERRNHELIMKTVTCVFSSDELKNKNSSEFQILWWKRIWNMNNILPFI